MTPFEAVVASVFYPFTLYGGLRLAHRGFTVGELGLVCFGGTAICMEFLHLTQAKVFKISSFLFTISWLTMATDLACEHTVHKDLPFTQPSFDLPDCHDRGVFRDRFLAVPISCALPQYCTTTRVSSAIPRGEATQSKILRSGLLCGLCALYWGSCGSLDTLVPWLS